MDFYMYLCSKKRKGEEGFGGRESLLSLLSDVTKENLES